MNVNLGFHFYHLAYDRPVVHCTFDDVHWESYVVIPDDISMEMLPSDFYAPVGKPDYVEFPSLTT